MSILVIFLSGCFQILPQEEEEEAIIDESIDSEEEQVVEVVPPILTPDNYYQSVIYDGTYLHGESRGFGTAVVDNRMDLDQLEMGLTRIAQQHFDPDTYFFREGQFIKRDQLNSWLMRYNEETNPTGLNPALGDEKDQKEREENHPRYLSHILEHNYLVKSEDGQMKLGGIVLGLSLNSVYNFRTETEDGLYNFYETVIPDDVIEREGKRIAEEILSRLRSGEFEDGAFQDIPIVIALFREQPRQSAIPGNFISQAKADPGNALQRWQEINEQYYLFPSSEASEHARGEADQFQRFKDDVQGFFDSYIGVVGKGRYLDNKIQELSIEIPIRFQGKAEIVALTQYAASQLQQRFDPNYKISLKVSSVSGKLESLIVQNPGSEPIIHIFD
ncbi:CamS family sex pheromone protein [Bacillus sp. YZJH907-2]|uniref:CamS family sex pheromone protein n=2 Tax=Halalkalibacter suaedae TaxID=2822140 RepID=A0A941ARG6_9BACI|nr:CamS family sex pheromone protein [Bacillus suaedae]MBP3952558.1 CamS family sex pheromone protein [Bacillus suaedae]